MNGLAFSGTSLLASAQTMMKSRQGHTLDARLLSRSFLQTVHGWPERCAADRFECRQQTSSADLRRRPTTSVQQPAMGNDVLADSGHWLDQAVNVVSGQVARTTHGNGTLKDVHDIRFA
jgi:hypothetical protein